jgi:tripartite-type tricarboxylate transporter receptor subunit TctC
VCRSSYNGWAALSWVVAIFAVTLLVAARLAEAQGYPARTVVMIVPTGPGGGMEMLARIFAQRMEQRLGQPFVIENRAGAGGIIGTSFVARANPDGYTVLVANSTNLAINVSLYKDLSYDPTKDLVPVILYAFSPWVLVVNPALPVYSAGDLVRLAKTKPGELTFGSAGAGTAHHLFAEMFRTETGINVIHVPYKSTMQPLNDVVAGHLQFMFTDLPPSQGLIEQGKLRALGVSSKTRLAAAPDIPTLAESGVPGFEALSWQMIALPAGTPPEIVNKLHSELKAIVAMPEVKQRIDQLGLIPVSSPPPDELRNFIKIEIARWAKVVADAGLTGSE